MLEQFSESEMSTLRSTLLDSMLDRAETAEVLQMFLIGHGYGVSQESAVEAATRVGCAGLSVAVIRQELERIALVM
jgi:hypothetical protein